MEGTVKTVSKHGETGNSDSTQKTRRYLFLLSAMKQGWILFVLSLVSVIAANLAMGPGLAITLKTFTDALTARDSAGVVVAGMGMMLVALVAGMGNLIGTYALGRLSEKVSLNLRRMILGRALRAPLPYLESRASADLVSCLINDIESTKQVFSGFQDLVANVALVGASIVNLFVWSWPVALTVISLAFLCALSGGVFAGRVKKVSDTYQANLARITETATAIFTGIAVIKSLEKEELLAQKFGTVSRAQYDVGTLRGKIMALQGSVSRLAPEMSSVCLLLVAGVLTISGRITPGQAVALSQLGSLILWPMAYLGEKWTNLQQFLAGADRVAQALNIPQEDHALRKNEQVEGETQCLDPSVGKDIPTAIAFHQVSFGYSEEKRVLSGVSFRIPKGQKTVVVGPSGSGKSTLGKLLLRFYEPQEGAVTIFGRDVRTIALATLRKEIAFVSQEPWIFPGTVRDNVLLGDPDATTEDVIQACMAAQAHDFICELPGGYDCMLKERGGNLSGGQRQRICLARAFLKKAPLLLLDEPTSAVDAESERLINQAVKEYASDRTVIVISHTPEMMKYADLVLTVKDGNVVASAPDSLSS